MCRYFKGQIGTLCFGPEEYGSAHLKPGHRCWGSRRLAPNSGSRALPPLSYCTCAGL